LHLPGDLHIVGRIIAGFNSPFDFGDFRAAIGLSKRK